MFGTVDYVWYFIGVSEGAMTSSDCDDVPIEVETRGQCRRRRAVVTRRLVPLAGGPSVPLGVAATNAVVSCWKKPSTLVCITSGAHFVGFQYCSSFLLRYYRPFREQSCCDTDPRNWTSACYFVSVSLRRRKDTNSGANHE